MEAKQSDINLYQYEVCPFCWKARVGMALKEIPFSKVEVHPLNKKEITFSKDYRKVPILVDGEKQVNDSTDILKYLNEEYRESGVDLFPSGVETQKWLDWSEKFVKAIPPLIYKDLGDSLKAFDYITKATQFSWMQRKLIKYSGAFVMKMVAKKSKEKQNIQDESEHFKGLVAEWGNALGEKPFMGGDNPDAADAAVFGYCMSLKGLPASELLRTSSSFYAWLERMEAKSQLRLNS